jgi:hypothetical protein
VKARGKQHKAKKKIQCHESKMGMIRKVECEGKGGREKAGEERIIEGFNMIKYVICMYGNIMMKSRTMYNLIHANKNNGSEKEVICPKQFQSTCEQTALDFKARE